MGLIDLAIQYVREEFTKFLNGLVNAEAFPISPRAYHARYYLLLREFLAKGASRAGKHILNPYRKQIAVTVILTALHDVFTYGYQPHIIKRYEKLLDELIGYH